MDYINTVHVKKSCLHKKKKNTCEVIKGRAISAAKIRPCPEPETNIQEKLDIKFIASFEI